MGAREVVHWALVRTTAVEGHPLFGPLRYKANDLATRRWGSQNVRINLHGHAATINFSNPYPFSLRRHPNYNAPQVELVAVVSETLGRTITVIDVGAAVGDTALLLLERCSTAIKRLDCVEGDTKFAQDLRYNLASDGRVHIHEAMLSGSAGLIRSLVRSQHPGTASAHGSDLKDAITLDDLLSDVVPDVIKVDTDGYDGPILSGAARLLRESTPCVIFEWHPKLCNLVGTDPVQAFDVLREAGYDRFVFFTKYGQFSHFGNEHLGKLEMLCTTSKTLPDWHYDVVALHATSEVDEIALADLRNWGDSGYR
jgi:FkbM family methyltransferase